LPGEQPATTKPQMMLIAADENKIAQFFDEDGQEQPNDGGFGKLGEVTPNPQ